MRNKYHSIADTKINKDNGNKFYAERNVSLLMKSYDILTQQFCIDKPVV